jgi:RNA polymerase sigma-70 factor (ECF subfamily)
VRQEANIPSDEELMRRICRAERKAFELLYERYFDKLVWFARGFVDGTHAAEDIVQEVFLKIIERPEQFDPGKKFSTWVYTVTANSCRQALRNEQNRLRIIRENNASYPAETENAREIHDTELLQKNISAAYESMNEKEKNIYTLRFGQELSIKEIAGIIQIPEGSVKSGIYYLLKKIAQHVKDFSHEK